MHRVIVMIVKDYSNNVEFVFRNSLCVAMAKTLEA
jgi:hypothetical protein